MSAFGGVLAFNRPLDAETAAEVAKLFAECMVAPGYDAAAREALAGKKNLRLMEIGAEEPPADSRWELKRISGGVLVQEPDPTLREADLKVASTARRRRRRSTRCCLRGRWPSTSSPTPSFSRAGRTVGVGAGQMSRVDSVKIAVMKAQESLAGTVVASDAFFPFPDGVEEAAKAGATAVIQPGGSVRDADVIAAADDWAWRWCSPACATSGTDRAVGDGQETGSHAVRPFFQHALCALGLLFGTRWFLETLSAALHKFNVVFATR